MSKYKFSSLNLDFINNSRPNKCATISFNFGWFFLYSISLLTSLSDSKWINMGISCSVAQSAVWVNNFESIRIGNQHWWIFNPLNPFSLNPFKSL
jgi:hypothetical protein